MNQFLGLAKALGTRGHAGARYIDREILKAVEHKEIDLPSDIINADGSLDLYEDVQSHFEIQYKRKLRRFVLRNNGWVGHIPLNDRYMLEIETRVPVANLERIISRAPIGNLTLFPQYSHAYLAADDRPKSLFDVLTDRFLFALEEVRNDGLLKEYVRRQKSGSSPAGRLDPFRTAVRTRTTRTPTAVFSTFERTTDIAPNRLLRMAVERLISYYLPLETTGSDTRLDRLIDASQHFDEVGAASTYEMSAEAIAAYALHLPEHRTAYFDALRFAGYIVSDQGMAIRGSGGLVMAPAAVVDFAAIFESYARSVLAQKYSGTGTTVLDGNIGGAAGAKESLFAELAIQVPNSDMKPDVVLKIENKAVLIIDVKYKPPQALPDRGDTEQLVCYATRYGCDNVMVLYPAFPIGRTSPVELVGNIGNVRVFRGVLDLGSEDLEMTEACFAEALLTTTTA